MMTPFARYAVVGLTLISQLATAHDLKTAINPVTLPPTVQHGFSQVTVASATANLVHVAGQTGLSDAGPNDFASQVDRAFAGLRAALAAAGATPQDVVKITLLIADYDAEKLAVVGAQRRAAFGDSPPASTLIPVPALYAPGVLFEIDAVAVVAGLQP